MGKRKYKRSKNDYQLKFIKETNFPYDNFARIYRSVLYNERFLKLSPKAQMLYIYMRLECKKGNNIKFNFPKSLYKKLMSPQTFHKAKNELEQNGFIKVNSFRTIANIYELSDCWKYDSIPKEEPKFIDKDSYKKYLEG